MKYVAVIEDGDVVGLTTKTNFDSLPMESIEIFIDGGKVQYFNDQIKSVKCFRRVHQKLDLI